MTTALLYEAEALPGLEMFAADELRARFPEIEMLNPRTGGLPFKFDGDSGALAALRTVTAVYRVIQLDVPRPKAFLGHQVFTQLRNAIQGIMAGQDGFSTLSLDAAGADSSVMMRVKSELAAAVNLQPAQDKGDLHLRVRKTRDNNAWEVLIRLTPRPLVTRAWRLHNVPGALNAATASVMASLTAPTPKDSIVNLCCGSASLMIERAALGEYNKLHGVDIDADVLGIAREHLTAAGVENAALVRADATVMPYADKSFDVLLADLPFGQLVGSHQGNLRLYPALLKEAARVARKNARFALVTHEKRLIGDVLARQSGWAVLQRIPINLNGLHPEIALLRRD